MKKIVLFIFFVTISLYAKSQNTLTGTVIDNSGAAIMGASVSIDGTYNGTLTDSKGKFQLKNVKDGKTRLLISYFEFGNSIVEVNVKGDTEAGKIRIEKRTTDQDHTESFADLVTNTKATIHFDTIYDEKSEKLYFADDVNSLNSLSSVFISTQGGGEGDHRISIRGFDQDNTGFFVNGIPVNDPFNGIISWSDWGSLTDVARTIQLQKGIGAGLQNGRNIAGSFNLLTGNGSESQSGSLKLAYGSGNTFKASALVNSGMINKRFSLSMGIIKKAGEGIIDKTWHDQWNFYLGSRLRINSAHTLDLYAFASPQNHAQNLRQQNIGSYSKKLAEKIDDYNQEAFSKIRETSSGNLFNPDWNTITSSYAGKQFRNGNETDRNYADFQNVNEDYNFKPMASLLWSAQWSNRLSQLTSLYYIGGKGGRTGYAGELIWDYSQNPSGIIDFNNTISSNAVESQGVLINNVDNRMTLGGISKFIYSWSRNLNTTIGLDIKKSQSAQFGELRDLLGGKYFTDNSSELRNIDFQAKLGDTTGYNYVKNIGNTGTFIQTEFSNDDIAFNVMFGWSGAVYSLQDKFRKGKKDFQKDSLLYLKSGILSSYQSKLGAKYIINDQMAAYGSIGFSLRPPVFNDVINSQEGAIASEIKNEYFLNYELGFMYSTPDQRFKSRAGLYITSWNNQIKSFYMLNASGVKDLNYVTGINSTYKGIELDLMYRLHKNIDIIFSGSVSDNKFTNKVTGSYITYETGSKTEVLTDYYLLNLKTGFSPGTQLKLSALWKPFKGSQIQLSARHMRDYYSKWDITSRISEETGDDGKLIQSWKVPYSTVLDISFNYDLPLKSRFGITLFGYLNNVLNTLYIQDAADNSPENGYIIKDSKGNIINGHSAERAQVFLGLQRNFNIGARFTF
ncbi:MAG: TonB-dependent receptor [Saprospiraceae bacterium]|nr:TonB-dependent receptor [Saprospiraceae bacterium]